MWHFIFLTSTPAKKFLERSRAQLHDSEHEHQTPLLSTPNTQYIFSTTALIVTVAITVAKTTLSIGAFSLLMKLGFLYLPQIFLLR